MNNQKTTLPSIFTVAFFCITLVPYVSAYIPVVVAQLGMFALIYVMAIIIANKTSTLHTKSKINDLFLILLSLYIPMLGIRLYVDFLLKGIDFFAFGSGYTIMFFYFMQIVLPALFLSRYRVTVDVYKVGVSLVAILSVCMVLSILKIANGDVELTPDGRFDNGYGIFSIEFGHYAVSLILTCVVLIKSSIKNASKPILVIIIAIGGLAAILAGSRGPILALMLCLGIYIISNTRNISKLLKIFCFLLIITPFIVYWAEEITNFFSSMGIKSAERIYDAFLGEESITNQTSGRDTLYKDAIYYFLESPLFGYSYLIPGKIYCHNILLEQYMALGIVGGSIFLGINIIGLRQAWNILRFHREYALIPLLYIQYFIFGCFSITIINLPQYWLFLLLTMNYSYSLYNRGSKQNINFHTQPA